MQGPRARHKELVKKKADSSKLGWLKHAWILRLPPYDDEGNKSDVFADLYVSKYAWTERGVWYGQMDKVAVVTHITHHVGGNEDICELQSSTGNAYHFMIGNIAAEIEITKSKKLKTVNLRKARKWWDDQSNKLKVVKTNIVIDAMSLGPGDMDALEQFMLRCVRAEREGSLPDMPNARSSILKVVFFSLSGIKWKKRVSNQDPQVEAKNVEEGLQLLIKHQATLKIKRSLFQMMILHYKLNQAINQKREELTRVIRDVLNLLRRKLM